MGHPTSLLRVELQETLLARGCTKQMGLRPWLGSKPYRYPLFMFVPPGKGEGFPDAWPSLALSPEDFHTGCLDPTLGALPGPGGEATSATGD